MPRKSPWLLASCLVAAVPTASFAAITTGLTNHVKLDEVGTPAEPSVDDSANALNGTNNGAVNGQVGIIDGAYAFDRTEDDAVLGLTAPTVVNAYTIGLWVNPSTGSLDTTTNAAASRRSLVGDSSGNLIFGIYGDGALYTVYRNGASAYTANNANASVVDENVWTHVLTTRTGNAVQFYVNGIFAASSVPGPSSGNTNDVSAQGTLQIGRGESNLARDFAGLIDDAAVWSTVKTAQEIALIHGLGRFVSVDVSDISIDDVLAAYNAQTGIAAAGGAGWTYVADLGSTTVGTIGGTIAGQNAFIVLGTDGSGVQYIPEPGSMALVGLSVLAVLRRRRAD